jgi:hypothetical protein
MLHTEPFEIGAPCAIGLHAHEKTESDRGAGPTSKAMQDAEIDKAIMRYHEGAADSWGVRKGAQARDL